MSAPERANVVFALLVFQLMGCRIKTDRLSTARLPVSARHVFDDGRDD